MAAWSVQRLWTLPLNFHRSRLLLVKNLQVNTAAILHVENAQQEMPQERKNVSKKKKSKTDHLHVGVVDYLKSSEKMNEIVNEIPSNLISINRKSPEGLYLVDSDVGDSLVETIKDYLPKETSSVPVIEINPGLGVLSRKLLGAGVKHLIMFEPDDLFHSRLSQMITDYPDQQVELRSNNLLKMTRAIYLDKIDNKNRVGKIMAGIASRPWSDSDPLVKVVGAAPNRSSLNELMYSVVFHTGFAAYGRPEYFLVVHPHNYIQLTSNKEHTYLVYRYNSILFQIIFKSKVLKKFPRKAFLPWEFKYEEEKHHRHLRRLQAIDSESLYLVHIEARRDLLEQLNANQLRQLWYFTRVCFLSRKNRIIPVLEKWIPNCGPRLIRQGLNIYTEFGDLTPAQLLKLFQLFSSWPEYPESPFLSSMETAFLKTDPRVEIDEEETEAPQ